MSEFLCVVARLFAGLPPLLAIALFQHAGRVSALVIAGEFQLADEPAAHRTSMVVRADEILFSQY